MSKKNKKRKKKQTVQQPKWKKDVYKQELNKIQASEEFEQNTIQFLLAHASEEEQTEKQQLQINKEKQEIEKKPIGEVKETEETAVTTDKIPQHTKKKKSVFFTAKKIMAAASFVIAVGGITYIATSVNKLSSSLESLGMQENFIEKITGQEPLDLTPEITQVPTKNYSSYFAIQQEIPEQASIEPSIMQKAETEEAAETETAEEFTNMVFQLPQKQAEYNGIYVYNLQNDKTSNIDEVAEINTLPVYKNSFQETQTGYIPVGLSQQEMENLVYEQALSLGIEVQKLDIENIEMQQGQETQGIYAVKGVSQEADTITVLRNGNVNVDFAAPRIPKVGLAPVNSQNRTEQDGYLYALAEEYDVLWKAMQTPKNEVSMEYTNEGIPIYKYSIYDAGDGKIATKLLNRTIRKITFNFNPTGELIAIELQRANSQAPITEKVKITQEQATERLLKGEAFTLAEQVDEIVEENISGVELIYWYIPTAQYIAPYYKFYVQHSVEENGLINYKEYYVLAIQE